MTFAYTRPLSRVLGLAETARLKPSECVWIGPVAVFARLAAQIASRLNWA